jgi:hypothetical protein
VPTIGVIRESQCDSCFPTLRGIRIVPIALLKTGENSGGGRILIRRGDSYRKTGTARRKANSERKKRVGHVRSLASSEGDYDSLKPKKKSANSCNGKTCGSTAAGRMRKMQEGFFLRKARQMRDKSLCCNKSVDDGELCENWRKEAVFAYFGILRRRRQTA